MSDNEKNARPIPPRPRRTVFSPFDATPVEAMKATASVGRDDDSFAESQDRYYWNKIARTDRYGR